MKVCRMNDCSGVARRQGLCNRHYERERRYGRLPLVRPKPRLAEGWRPDRYALAWAAGLADGEGSFYVVNHRTTRSRVMVSFDVAQSGDSELLERFKDAVGGLGNVVGPRHIEGHKPAFAYQVNGYERVQSVLVMIWPWLGSVKRAQASASLARARTVVT